MKPRNWLLFSCMVFLWGLNWSVMKMGLGYIEPSAFVLQRFAVSAAFLLPFSLALKNRMPRDKITLGKLIILSLIFVSVIIIQAVGLSQESAGVGAVLTYTQPLFVFILAMPLLKERVTKTKILGVTVGFTGVFMLFMNRTGSITPNSALTMLLGAFLWAVVAIYYKKFLNQVDPLITHFTQLSVGIIPLALLSLTTSTLTFPSGSMYIEILSFSSIGALATGNVIWFFLLKEEEAATVSGSSLVVPAIALFFGWRLLGEPLSLMTIFGSTLTLGGVYLINLKREKIQAQAGLEQRMNERL